METDIETKLGIRAKLIEERDMRGWSYRKIAEFYGLPLGTVKSRIHRGRKMIKAMEVDE